MQKKIMIFGATSAIAQEVAKLFAEQGDELFLVARNREHLVVIADDLMIRGAGKVAYDACDLTAYDAHARMIDRAIQILGSIDIALLAHGTLSLQTMGEQTVDYALQELNTNLLSHMSLLTLLANYFEKQKQGTIAVISSVAGDRGRQSNYIYGTAKGALSVFLQGLRQRLHKSDVNVLTIKPGFVDTPMTKAFKKGMLWVGPDTVAKQIVQAIHKRKLVVYTPGFWFYVMLIIKLIPERVFCRLKL